MSNKHQAKLGVVIVSYGNTEDILTLVKQIQAQLTDEDKIIIVDNKKPYELEAYLKEHGVSVEIVNHDNGGFGSGANYGASRLLNSVDMLSFINPDMEIKQDDFIAKLKSGFEIYDYWGAVILDKQTGKIQSDSIPLHITGLSWSGDFDVDLNDLNTHEKVTSVSGGCFWIKTDVWQKVGGFDEKFFMYYEDRDLCSRLNLIGAKCGRINDAYILHDYEFSKSGYKWVSIEVNRLASILKTWPTKLLLLTFIPNVLFNMVIFLQYLLTLKPHLKILADIKFLSLIPYCLRERKRLRKVRKILPREFFDTIQPTLNTPQLGFTGQSKFINWCFSIYYSALKVFM